MEMNNPFTNTPIFQSKNSHTNLLMNMIANNSDHRLQILQDDNSNPSLNGYAGGGMIDEIPRSTASTIINSSHTTHDDDDDDIDEANNNRTGAAGKKKAGHNNKCRKPKHAFQTRSQVDILDDGYRWRKYGQKAVKNNKFPRSYYRCTHQGCNVKKQIQRLSKDESIVVTTYEGTHSHPIDKSTDNFEHILTQMQIYTSY